MAVPAREGHGPLLLDGRLVLVQQAALAVHVEHRGLAPKAEFPDLSGGDALLPPRFFVQMASKSESTSCSGSRINSASCRGTQSLSGRCSKADSRISSPQYSCTVLVLIICQLAPMA